MTMVLRAKPLSDVVRGIIKRDNGVWLDASDLSTMYQDEAGTIPVTAMEQPVGLWLDKSQGLQLGPELIANGDFSQGSTGWYTGTAPQVTATSSFIGGVVTSTMSDSTGSGYDHSVKQSLSTTGKTLRISAQCISVTGTVTARVAVRSYNGSAYSRSYMTFTSGQSKSFLCTIPNGYWANEIWLSILSVSTGSAGTVVWDNISVREIKGNHATQSITASRPIISARKNLLLATDVLSTQSVTAVAAQQTLSFTGTGTVTLSGATTGTLIGTGANNRVSLTFIPTAGTLTLTVAGDVRLAQLEYGPTTITYQRVNTSVDYDTAGFPKYLKFDGVDDYLNLPYMGLYAAGSASIITGSALLRQAANACTLGEGNAADADSLYCISRQLAAGGNLDSVIIRDDATTLLDTTGSASALADGVASVRADVDTGTNVKLHKNSQQLTSDGYTRSGVVTLNTTTIGAKVGTAATLFNNLMLYGLIVSKSALSDSDRRKCEVYLGRKAGVQL